jgi:broad specificity phosphatase PhoE
MATELWLVRHGQAAFQADDYDQLTELGWQQARWLGAHLSDMGQVFDRVAAGTLRRQQETAAALADALGATVETVPGLEEYDAHALMTGAGFTDRDPALPRSEHFRRLCALLNDWSEGRVEGAETWEAFRARVMQAVAELTRRPGRVIAASSGGAIAMVLAEVLGLQPDRMVDLNLQARNTGISRLVFTSRTVYVNMVNAVPHLERPDRHHAETYS